MTDEKIKEGNKIIAEFMELGGFQDGRYGWMWHNPTTKDGSCFSLEYNTSWDWLMPVVEKIEGFENHMIDIKRCNYPKLKFTCTIIYTDDYKGVVHKESKNSKIEAAYMAVVKYVKEYNKLKKTIK